MNIAPPTRKRRPPTTHDRWLVSYSDFVTLLFALFVVLYASSRHNGQNVQQVSGAIHSGFDALSAEPPPHDKATPRQTADPAERFNSLQLSNELRSLLGDSLAKQEIVLQQTPAGLVISLREFGFFNSGEAKLLPGATDKLVHVAELLKQHDLEVRVEGHSDDQPIHNAFFHSNWDLSTTRAMAVLNLFLEGANFNPTRLSVAGYGPYRPIADNSTAQGRRINRRVDLVVLTNNAKSVPVQ